LVAAKNVPDEWVLPKGHVAAGEDPGAGASRKVAEEDGIMARTIGSIPGRVTFATVHDGVPEVVTAIFCLMEYRGDADGVSENRTLRWLPLNDTLAALTFSESRDMLTRAEELRRMSEQAH
jgi:ADP-ribose pyrophosphatase YjhB (NUDIX family)